MNISAKMKVSVSKSASSQIRKPLSKIIKTKNMTSKQNLLGFILLTLLFVSCNNKGLTQDFDYGRIENNKYYNPFFNLEMIIPTGWIVQSKEQTENLTKKGADLVAGDDKNLKAVIKASDVNTAYLLTIFKYEVGSAVDYNPGFILLSENLKNSPGIKTGSDYLFQVRKMLKQSQIQYDYIDENFGKETVNGQDFFLMNASIDYMGLQIKQVYYSTIINGFSFGIIISYVSKEQKQELDNVINSMKFRK